MQEMLMPTVPVAPDNPGALRTKSAESWGQVLGQPAQSNSAETTNTGDGAAAPLVQEIDDPGYQLPDRADMLPEPDNGKPEDDDTDDAAKEPARWQTDSVVGWPADLDVTADRGPDTPANANRQARPKRSSRKTSPNTEGASKRAADKEAQAKRVEAIVRRISSKQAGIGKNERANVRVSVEIGVDLIELKREAGKCWAKRARELGYHPRAASRLQLLGRMWGDWIGPNGSDLLARLPADLKVLERVCQIPVEQLEEFLNCKDASERDEVKPWNRKRFAAEVDARIGKAARPPKPTRPLSPEQIVVTFAQTASETASALQRSNTQGASFNELRARLHDVLDEAINQLEATSGPETIDSARISPE
jgi:hypothetical protein